METHADVEQALRIEAVAELVDLSPSTVYRLAREGRFPSPRRVTERVPRWLRSEIIAWLQTRPRLYESDGGPGGVAA